ncbi:MAG: hypothetical protein RBS57_02905, partial [Desulforhabdus sp.]|nr:hypothetical protein [Desulforhabdus sp.]
QPNTSYLFRNLQLLTIGVERFPEPKEGARMCGLLAEIGAERIWFDFLRRMGRRVTNVSMKTP